MVGKTAGALATMVVAPKWRSHCILYQHELQEGGAGGGGGGGNQLYLRMALKKQLTLLYFNLSTHLLNLLCDKCSTKRKGHVT